MQAHNKQAILHGFLNIGTLRECQIPRREKSISPFEERTAPGSVHHRVDVVVGSGMLVHGKDELISSSLMFDVTWSTPQDPWLFCNRARDALRARGCGQGEAPSMETHTTLYSLISLAFSTCECYASECPLPRQEPGQTQGKDGHDNTYCPATWGDWSSRREKLGDCGDIFRVRYI